MDEWGSNADVRWIRAVYGKIDVIDRTKTVFNSKMSTRRMETEWSECRDEMLLVFRKFYSHIPYSEDNKQTHYTPKADEIFLGSEKWTEKTCGNDPSWKSAYIQVNKTYVTWLSFVNTLAVEIPLTEGWNREVALLNYTNLHAAVNELKVLYQQQQQRFAEYTEKEAMGITRWVTRELARNDAFVTAQLERERKASSSKCFTCIRISSPAWTR